MNALHSETRWCDDPAEIAALYRWLDDRGEAPDNVAYFLEKAHKWQPEYGQMLAERTVEAA